MNVGVVGLGKLGSVLAAHLAAAGHIVAAADTDPFAFDRLVMGATHAEPGLNELLGKAERLFNCWTDMMARGADVIFVVVPTPSLDDGNFDDSYVLKAVQSIGDGITIGSATPTVVVVSTLTPGTMERSIGPALDEAAGRHIPLAYSPQFIALGSVVHDMANPDLVLIGSDESPTADQVWVVLSTIVQSNPHVARLSLTEAEIAKLAINCMVTSKISWANTIAAGCAKVGADPSEVLKAVGADSRIGGAYLKAGGPFGGPCFPRDNRAMAAWLRSTGTSAGMALATQQVNDRVVWKLAEILVGYRSLAILGLAYKPGTPEWTESLGVRIAARLKGTGVEVIAHDPQARPPGIKLAASAQEAIDQADVVLIATPWQEYETLKIDKDVLDPWRTL